MPISDFLKIYLTQLAFTIPLMIIWVVGFILAIVTWKKHPKTSLLALISFVIFFINNLISSANSFLPLFLQRNYGWGGMRISSIVMGVSIVTMVIAVAAWILLLIALFSRRKEKES